MKRFLCVWLTMLAVMGAMAVPVLATETAVETAAETVTETVTATETAAEETIPEDVAKVIASATPEQIEHIKQYILAGLALVDTSETPFWDRVKNFAVVHLDALAWILAACVFAVYFIGNRMLKKTFSTGTAVLNNNVVELAERSAAVVEAAKEDKQAVLQRAEEIRDEALAACERMLEEVRAVKEASAAEIAALKTRETSCAEALSLMATEINQLLQVSSLSEWKRDELQVTFDEAMAKVEEVMHRDDEAEGQA